MAEPLHDIDDLAAMNLWGLLESCSVSHPGLSVEEEIDFQHYIAEAEAEVIRRKIMMQLVSASRCIGRAMELATRAMAQFAAEMERDIND